MFFTLLVLVFSCLSKTVNANIYPEIPTFEFCVLPEMSEAMLRSLEHHPAYAQLDIVICQPHEECSPMSLNINVGKYGLG